MVGVLAYVYREQVQSELDHNLNSTFRQGYMVHAGHTAAIDTIQQQYKCCGASSFENWEDSVWIRESNTTNLVPDSCCKTVSPGCGRSNHPSNIPYTGCVHSLTDNVRHQLFIICVVALGICVLPVFGIGLSCCVYIKLRNYAYSGY
ncbi:hypothetical protein AAG570_005470 [Ranatra chinensis]|uniref:CD63 antigen n=1 Tax=Ranatra chinensis TaxID=642074 RepID=A0ABD0Y036_9HEMI